MEKFPAAAAAAAQGNQLNPIEGNKGATILAWGRAIRIARRKIPTC